MAAERSADSGFAGFVHANTAALLRTAYLLTGNALAAEELVQDTLVRLYPKWHQVQAADVEIAYVRRAVTNTFLNQKRRPGARRELITDTVPDAPDRTDAFAQLADRDEVWSLLERLPDRQRAALVLRYFHDLPDADVAAALECRVGTVRSLISRGLAALRDGLSGEQATSGDRRLA